MGDLLMSERSNNAYAKTQVIRQLKEDFKKKAADLSYYNAAEGSWSRERIPRQNCRKELKEITQQLKDLDVTREEIVILLKDMLVSINEIY
jgi:hypothetical protein